MLAGRQAGFGEDRYRPAPGVRHRALRGGGGPGGEGGKNEQHAYQFMCVERPEEGAALAHIRRSEQRNALNAQVMSELADALARLGDRSGAGLGRACRSSWPGSGPCWGGTRGGHDHRRTAPSGRLHRAVAARCGHCRTGGGPVGQHAAHSRFLRSGAERLPDELWTKIGMKFYCEAADAVFKGLAE